MPLLKPKTVKFKLTQEEFNKQADEFLSSHGFPADREYRKLFGAFVQHLPEHQDFFTPSLLAAMMRKAIANEKAFWLMNPERWEKEQAANEKVKDDTEAAAAAKS